MGAAHTFACCRKGMALLLASLFAFSHGTSVRARVLQAEHLRPRRALVAGRPRLALVAQAR